MLNMKMILLLLLSFAALAQSPNELIEDDFNVGGDIFSDFNEDLEASQVMEDERFYRYSRFFGVNIGVGATTFTGNRGRAYTDDHPSFALTLMYFLNFQNVFIMGFEYSKHTMFIDGYVNGFKDEQIGAVETNFLRPFFGFRYYVDTSDLGTAITYSNPYFVGRVEYWYQTNIYVDNKDDISDDSQGGLGTGFGVGLEFPIEIKKSYFNVEFMYHVVNFFDKNTTAYQEYVSDNPSDPGEADKKSNKFYNDLNGDVITFFASYNISW